MTLQRFDTEPSASASQHLESNTKRKQAEGGRVAGRRKTKKTVDFIMLISFTSHLGSWVWRSRKKKGNRNRTNKERCWNAKLKSGFSLFLTVEGNDLPLAQSKSPVVPTGVWALWIQSRPQQIWPILQHVTARAKPLCYTAAGGGAYVLGIQLCCIVLSG